MEQGGPFLCAIASSSHSVTVVSKAMCALVLRLPSAHGFGEGACTLISRAVLYPATSGGFGLG